jgi:uncharacterized protein YebE (UPF0316 family)
MFEQVAIENPVLFGYVILPLLIFCARIVDVSMSTFRIVFVARGMKHLAPVVGFFEILIWLVAIGQIFRNLNNVVCYLAYAGGFATGNFVGIYIAEKIAIGKVMLRIVTSRDSTELQHLLKERNYGVTTVDAQGAHGMVKILFSIIPRRSLPDVLALVQRCNPRAFYAIEDVRSASEGIFPIANGLFGSGFPGSIRSLRKSK